MEIDNRLVDLDQPHCVIAQLSEKQDDTVNQAFAIMGATKSAGPDESVSLEPPELAQLVQGRRTVWEAVERVRYVCKSSEHDNALFLRPLYGVKDIPAGREFTASSIRPALGLAPKHNDEFLERRAKALEISQLQ